MPGDPHGPNRWANYVRTHDACMEAAYQRGFVQKDNLGWEAFSGGFWLRGAIVCLGQITITVEKTLVVVNEATTEVVTRRYAYAASVRHHGQIFRHDYAEHHGHPDPHHRHDFDWRTDVEAPGSPTWVGRGGWPTLGQFIEMVEAWYHEHRSELPQPDAVADLPPVSSRVFFMPEP